MLKHARRKFSGFLIWLGMASAVGAAFQDAQDSSTRVVLLKNGNVLQGRAEPAGQHLHLWTESGSRLVLPNDQVDAVFQSLSGAYRYQRERLPRDAVQDHVRLFEWCLRYKLWDEAQAQIDWLQFQPLSRTELWRLSESLSLARAASARSQLAAAESLDSPFAAPGKSNEPWAGPSTSEVRAVSYFENAPEGQRLLPQSTLNELVARLDPSLVRQYERQLDSMFIRNCGNAGCHDSRNSKLALLQVQRGTGSTRLMKLQNMIRILQHWGHGSIERQPLWRAAVEPHAGLARPIMSPDSIDYRTLELFIQQMGDQPHAAGITGLDLTLNASSPPAIAFPALSKTGGAPQPFPRQETSSLDSSSPSWAPPRALKLEQDINTFVPRDPFDPEIFNRLYLRRKSADSTDSATQSGNEN